MRSNKKLQHRPPHDMSCPTLQVSDGCTHGKCKFCDIYHGVPFHMVSMEEIEEDLEEVAKQCMRNTHRIYLTGGNPFSLSTERLVQIFDTIEERIPQINSYGGFCRIMDVARKSDEELRLLAERGVQDICIGAESGYDPALAFMDKGNTSADIVEQSRRLHAVGIDSTFFYLTGIAGAGKGQENAIASAEVFSAAAPKRILIVCITPCKTWGLAEDIAAGRWEPPTEIEMAEEIRTFIEHLTCETYIICSHDTDIIRFDGRVPQDQEKMLQLMDHYIPLMNPKSARYLREQIHHAKF